jgi:hypothetical protein
MKRVKLAPQDRGKFSDDHLPHANEIADELMNNFGLHVPPPLKADDESDRLRATDIFFCGVPIAFRVRQSHFRTKDDFSIRIRNNGRETEIDKLLRGVGPRFYLFGYSADNKCKMAEAWLFDMDKIKRGGFLEKDAHGIYVYHAIDNGDGTAALYLPIAHTQRGRRSLSSMGCIVRQWNARLTQGKLNL